MNGEAALRIGLGALGREGLISPPGLADRLLAYLVLLEKWNKTYNLTAIRDIDRMVTHHLLDSLAVFPHLGLGAGQRLLDVGSGAGLPGIPIAMADPALDVVLLDSSAKKTTFLQQAVGELGLGKVTVVQGRVEEFRPAAPFACIISRAFAETAEFVRAALPLLAPGGQVVAMKGVVPHEELTQLPANVRHEVIPIRVPGLDAERCIVKISLDV